MKVIVTGMGPGDSGLLTAEAEKTIRQADVVLTSKRLAQDLTKLNSEVKVMGVMETVDFIRLHSKERMDGLRCGFRRYRILQHCFDHRKAGRIRCEVGILLRYRKPFLFRFQAVRSAMRN